MIQFSIARKLKIAFYISMLFTAAVLYTMYINMRKTVAESANTSMAINALLRAENILSNLKAAEVGTHGYFISGKESFLLGHKNAMIIVNQELDFLSTTALHTKDAGNILKEIKELVATKKIKENAEFSGYDAATVNNIEANGKATSDKINSLVTSIAEKERAFLQKPTSEKDKYNQRLTWSFIVLAILFFLILVNGYMLLMRDIKKSELINQSLHYNSTLLNNISDAIIATDEKFLIKDWNKYAEELYGYKAEEVIGKKISAVINLKDEDRATFFEIAKRQKIWKGEMLHFHKDGHKINVEVSTSAINNVKGEFIGAIGVIHDISQRVLLEDRLKELSIKLQKEVNIKSNDLDNFFERIADAFFILDNNWGYTYLNKNAIELHGDSENNLLGNNIWKLFPELVDGEFYKSLHEAKETQQIVRSEIYYPKEDKWFEDLIYPSKDGISIYYNDITAKKKAALELKKVHERLSFHLNNTPLAVIEFNSNMEVMKWSKKATEIFGWTEKEVAEEKFSIKNIINKEDLILFNNNLHFTQSDPQLVEVITTKCFTKNGNVIYCEWYNSFLKDENNNTGVMLSLVKDTTTSKIAQLELSNAESKFRGLVEQSLVGVYIRHQENLVYVNPRFAEIFGYTETEIYQFPNTFSIVDVADKTIVTKHIEEYEAGKINKHHYEFKGKHKDGHEIYLEVFGSSTNHNGQDAVIGSVLDITERKKASEEAQISSQALQKSNERFELVAKATNDAIWDWDMKTDQLTGNETFCNLFGKPVNTIFKFEQFIDKVSEEEKTRLKNNFDKAIANKDTLLMEEFSFKFSESITKIMNDRAYILYKNGEAYRMLGAMQDVTAVKEAEQSLINSEQKYKLLFNENPLPMWILLEHSGRFIDANLSAINSYGYSKEEFLEMPIINLHPKNDEAYFSWLKKSDKEKLTAEMNWEHQKKDGSIIKVNILSSKIQYQGQNATLALANDVTANYLAEESLQKSKQAFKELAAHLETIRENERTHMAREIHDELGQQLTGLKMDISWINKKIKTDEPMVRQKMQDTIELIDKTVITVRRIATQLRPSILDDLGLIEAMEWQSEEFSKRSEIKSVFKTNMNHVKVSQEVATGVFRIFQESLTNVSRHSKASEVNTVFKIEDNILTLSIEDNGIGFKEENIKNKKTLGLLGMKERVSLINGTYLINGNTGLGTSVLITVPLL
jgi:PAS domain S-box-containing protein